MKKSNDTYGWMQDLKDLAEAEKSLEIIPYVSILFERKKKGSYDGQVLHTLDMPRSMLDRWRWLIRWREGSNANILVMTCAVPIASTIRKAVYRLNGTACSAVYPPPKHK